MDITYIPPARQGLLLLYSFIIGYLSGAVSGVAGLPARILKRILCKNKTAGILIDALLDILASVLYIIVMITFIYAANEGIIRYFLLLSALSGVIVYSVSAGRLLKKLETALSKLLCRIAGCVSRKIRKIIYPVKAGIGDRAVMKCIIAKITTAHGR